MNDSSSIAENIILLVSLLHTACGDGNGAAHPVAVTMMVLVAVIAALCC